jgi:DNA-binding beta-propeller fold protein YncE
VKIFSLFPVLLIVIVASLAGCTVPVIKSDSDTSLEKKKADVTFGNAEVFYKKGVAAQKQRKNELALAAYLRALELNPNYAEAHYEIGWAYWVMNNWKQVVHHWQRAKKLGVKKSELEWYLGTAKQNLSGKLPALTRTKIGLVSTAAKSSKQASLLQLIARFQHYNPRPQHKKDKYDPYMFSPKSVRFLPDNSKAYVNALEGFSTLVYDPKKLKRTNVIAHRFTKKNQKLFIKTNVKPWYETPKERLSKKNFFNGKPVESALSHKGKYLWIPYYRRDYDTYGTLPSAVAIIDTRTSRIIRVMETGPIPKYVVASADGKWMAIIHWGDNTIGLIDIGSDNPMHFTRGKLITIGKRLKLNKIKTTDRDHGCGFCLRGSVFTPDSKHLLIGRMGGGGVAVVSLVKQKYLGTVFGMKPTPRHLVLSPNGEHLYISSSFAGVVSKYRVKDFLTTVKKKGRKSRTLKPLQSQKTGPATRTIALSPDGSLLFAAVNRTSRIVVLQTKDMKPIASIDTDSYPVGMAVSPDGTQLWVTAQGKKRRGGNSVSVYRIKFQSNESQENEAQ